ncbi:MAG TPA: flagellar hook-basal body complex protein [Xanthobacteraceae bacterium]|nr:flagellar hook-basal body complex protein [Xanthobacteraceae bacterium]
MGIFGALTNAVTGMRAQSYALENIAGNIANAQTTGFKRIDTSFEDLIPDTSERKQLAGSVNAYSRSTNTVQGDIQTASIGTFMAINGEGFFVVQKPSSVLDGRPVFDDADLYTRRGDFQTNRDGYLVNGAGYYLMGIPIDPSTGNLAGSVPQVLQFANDFLPALPTTQIEYRANLPAYPLTQAHDTAVPGSELLDATGFAVDPFASGTGTVLGADVTSFIQQTISGGAVTAYDTQGLPVNVQLRWAKTDSLSVGGTDSWELFYQVNGNAGAADVAWQNAGVTYTFGVNGQLSPPITNITLTNVTVNGNVLGDVKLLHGMGGLTQFSDPNGSVQVNLLQQNGYPAGTLESIAVSEEGRLVGTYSNGRTIDLAEITLARFNGPDRLRRVDGGAFLATPESGTALYGAAGTVVGNSLEGSNTDIADEFTKLIVTQQAYSANTRIISTSNAMVQDLLNMMR